MHGAEELVMVLLGIVVLLMVVRPLVNRIITPEQPGAGHRSHDRRRAGRHRGRAPTSRPFPAPPPR